MKTFTVHFTGTMIVRINEVNKTDGDMRNEVLSALLSAEISANALGNPRIHILAHGEPIELKHGVADAPAEPTGC